MLIKKRAKGKRKRVNRSQPSQWQVRGQEYLEQVERDFSAEVQRKRLKTGQSSGD